MVERGVRFVELLTPARRGIDRWDQHGNLESGHRTNAKAVDQPIAALLKDLKARGLLGQTLVVWGGEFGRTPCAQFADGGYTKSVGRDHNPFGFNHVDGRRRREGRHGLLGNRRLWILRRGE